MKRLKKIFLIITLIILLAILAAVTYVGIMITKYQTEAKKTVSDAGEQAFKAEQTSIIYDKEGNVITNLIGEKDLYYLEYDKIPFMIKQALITSEDRKFYEHSGIDYFSIARAVIELVKNKGEITQGASTITQQLARNIFLTHEISYERKIKEMFIAMEIEKQYDKNKILEFYINNIYFGNGLYGIQAASKGYFSKSIEELSLSEMVFLCSIPNNPSLYDPYLYTPETIKRRDRILLQMYEQGDIDEELYNQAKNEEIVLRPSKNPTNNYVETYVRHSAILSFMENDGFEFRYSFENDEDREKYYEEYYGVYNEWSHKLYTGGYRIYTSLDMKKQAELQKIIDEELSYYKEKSKDDVYVFQGAATCVDNKTGRVVAIVGGRTDDKTGYTINRAYQSHRQAGSSIKPLIVYTPMLERGYTPDTIVKDEKIPGGPANATHTYEGEITLRHAVETSKNTVAWNLFEELTPQVGLEYLLKMNFTRIVEEDYVPAASLGGFTYGVSTVEMASAYSTIENNGIFRDSTCIVRVTNASGEEIIKNHINKKRVYEKNATYMMTDMLKDVFINGTGKKFNIANAICAGKTGTTNENRDVWLVGYSAYYTTAVWCGYDMPREINDGYGTMCSGNIWAKFMTYIHEGLEVKDFPEYVSEEEEMTEETTEETIKETAKETIEETAKETTEDDNETAPGGGEIYSEYWGE